MSHPFEPRHAPPAYQDLILKLWREGMSTYQIATALNFTEGSVYNALARAREAVRPVPATQEAERVA